MEPIEYELSQDSMENVITDLRGKLEPLVGHKVRIEVVRLDYRKGTQVMEELQMLLTTEPGLNQKQLYDRLINKPTNIASISAYLKKLSNVKVEKKDGLKCYSIGNCEEKPEQAEQGGDVNGNTGNP